MTLAIEQFGPLSDGDRNALSAEGQRLLRFAAEPGGAERFEIRFAGSF